MRIVKLKGGLGNQMFQYSFATLIREMTSDNVLLDYSAYENLNGDLVRVPRIKKFNLQIHGATKDELSEVLKIRHRENSLTLKYKLGIFAENLINNSYFFEKNRAYVNPQKLVNYRYYDGYWQSFKYIDRVFDVIKTDFSFTPECMSEKTKSAFERIKTDNSVFVGVRKGDYTFGKAAVKHYGSFGSSYYKQAMDYISERVDNPVYYVFSNDIPWCKNNIDWGTNTIVYREPEDQTDDFEELFLMSSCKHAIIVNSTYHWWGARLNDNPSKIVCCPSKWFFDDSPIDIIPGTWKKIKGE